MILTATSLFSDAQLRAYYPFDSDINDHFSTNNLINENSTPFIGAKYGGGLQCSDSGGQYADAALRLLDSGSVSVNFWIKEQTPVFSGHDDNLLFSSDSVGLVKFNLIYEYNGGTPRLHASRIRNTFSGDDIFYTTTLSGSLFTQITLTYDGSTMILYVNGASVGSVASSGTGAGTISDHVWVGHNDATSGSNCIFDDMSFFGRALTQAEISILSVDVPQGVML